MELTHRHAAAIRPAEKVADFRLSLMGLLTASSAGAVKFLSGCRYGEPDIPRDVINTLCH
ncbi:MAG: hypothetical protein AB2792_15950 [Candidatus Thiodiazotropha sp.]